MDYDYIRSLIIFNAKRVFELEYKPRMRNKTCKWLKKKKIKKVIWENIYGGFGNVVNAPIRNLPFIVIFLRGKAAWVHNFHVK